MTNRLPLPKYHQIYLVLKERLADHVYDKGFPGEFDLMKEFDAGRVTVRRALDGLVQEGLISRKPGRGTVVCDNGDASNDSTVRRERSGLLDNLVHVSLGTTVKVINLEVIPANAQVSKSLEIELGTEVQKVTRVRSADAGPLSVTVTHVPLLVASAFNHEQLSQQPILTLLQSQGLELGRAEQSISARLADATYANWLDLPVGAALMTVKRLVRDVYSRPIQLLYGAYRPDRYEYEMSLSRGGDLESRIWISTALNASFQ